MNKKKRNNLKIKHRTKLQSAFAVAIFTLFVAFWVVGGMGMPGNDMQQEVAWAAGVSVGVFVNGVPGKPILAASTTCTNDTSVVNLSWHDSEGATAYSISRDGTNLVSGFHSMEYTDVDVIGGQGYVYVVTASGAGGDSVSDPFGVDVLDCGGGSGGGGDEGDTDNGDTDSDTEDEPYKKPVLPDDFPVPPPYPETEIPSPVGNISDISQKETGSKTKSNDFNKNSVSQHIITAISGAFHIDQQSAAQAVETAAAVSTGVAVISAGTAAATSMPMLSQIFGNLRALFAMPYRKKQRWGVVYDTKTGEPLAGVSISIIGEDGKVMEAKNTDRLGFYSFMARPGTYTISVQKPGYVPVENESVVSLNTYYDDSYISGDAITIKEGEVVSVNIPMRGQQETTFKKAFNPAVISHLAFWIGFMFSVFALVVHPDITNYAILLVFVCGFVINMFYGKSLRMGLVLAVEGVPAPFAAVKVFEKSTGALSARTVTNEKGAFVLVLNEGEYMLEAESGSLRVSKDILLKKRSDVHEKLMFDRL